MYSILDLGLGTIPSGYSTDTQTLDYSARIAFVQLYHWADSQRCMLKICVGLERQDLYLSLNSFRIRILLKSSVSAFKYQNPILN